MVQNEKKYITGIQKKFKKKRQSSLPPKKKKERGSSNNVHTMPPSFLTMLLYLDTFTSHTRMLFFYFFMSDMLYVLITILFICNVWNLHILEMSVVDKHMTGFITYPTRAGGPWYSCIYHVRIQCIHSDL